MRSRDELVAARINWHLAELRTLAAATDIATARLLTYYGGWRGFDAAVRRGSYRSEVSYLLLNLAAKTAYRDLAEPLWPAKPARSC
jgi:hypothetical protein